MEEIKSPKNVLRLDTLVETEVWSYSIISSISEMVAVLGLFVGFAFLSVWDCLAIFRFRI